MADESKAQLLSLAGPGMLAVAEGARSCGHALTGCADSDGTILGSAGRIKAEIRCNQYRLDGGTMIEIGSAAAHAEDAHRSSRKATLLMTVAHNPDN